MGLDKLGVQLNNETGKIIVSADESTSVPNIYAFGDIGEVSIVNRHHTDNRNSLNNSQDGKTLHIIISLNLDCKNELCANVSVKPHPSHSYCKSFS